MAATLRLSNNEKEFIESALREDHRIDGRRPFDSRRLSIKFAKEDGTVEVQLGQTRTLAVVSAKLEAPYPDRPNEGSLAIYTEFSPMSDPSFEPGRPGEFAVELGRIIDRGLRESRAVDTESLCVVSGRAVWALRLDLHILDNGGNLVDAANIAALAALLSFRRPDCTVGGLDGQEIIVHPPEVREPLPLILHHLPIAVTFAFFVDGALEVLDPSFKEEAVMGSRLCITVNAHGEVCAIQKGGGVGVTSSEIVRCLRIASAKAADITAILKKAVESHELERAQRKVKRHPVVTEPIKQTLAGKEASGNFFAGIGVEGKSSIGSKAERKEHGGKMANRSKVTAEYAILDNEEHGRVLEVAERMNTEVQEMSTDNLRGKKVVGSNCFQRETGKSDAVTSLLQTSEARFGNEALYEVKGVTELSVRNTHAQQPGKHVQESLRGSMSAAAVYANQMPQHHHEHQRGGLLGPIFPKFSDTVDLKVKQNSSDMLVESRDSHSESITKASEMVGGNQDLLSPKSLSIEKKLKKRKKSGSSSELPHVT